MLILIKAVLSASDSIGGGILQMMLGLFSRILGRTEEQRGQTLVEYALIIALVALAIVVSLTALEGGIEKVFSDMVALF